MTIPRFGLRLRMLALPTPMDAGQVELRLAVSVRRHGLRGTLSGALWRPVDSLVQCAALRRLTREVRSDIEVWRHKTYLDRPVLSAGDGPIREYRSWARQFYPAARAPSSQEP
jgi:hypothetical protein